MGEIKTRVEYLIKKFGTNCPFKISQALGIQIVYEELGNTFGYYSKHFRIPIIHINQNANDIERRFICSHELGHAIEHSDINTSFLKRHTLFSTEKIEVEANTFAVELLLPDDLLIDLIDTSYTIYDVFEANGIPKEFVSLKSIDGKKFLN